MDKALFFISPFEVKLHEELPRFRQEMGDVESLALSLKEKGQLQPIVLTKDNELVCGGRRLAACMLAQIEVLARRIEGTDPLYLRELELLENVERKDFTPAERAMAIAEIHNIKQSQAPIPANHSIRDTAALLGVSHTTVARAISTAEVVEQFPELAKAKTDTAINKAAKGIQRQVECAKKIDHNRKLMEEKKEECRFTVENCCMSQFLAGLESNSIDILCTDPVYGISIDVIGAQTGGAVGGMSAQGIGYDDSAENALPLLKLLAEEGARVCKEDAHGYIFVGPEHFQTVRGYFTDAGWQCYIKPLIWIKRTTGQTNQPAKWPSSCYEMILYARRPGAEIIKQGQPDWLECPPVIPTEKTYMTEKPVALIRSLLQRVALPGFTMLDPFAGSGALLHAGMEEGMFVYGCDVSKEAFALTLDRLRRVQGL